MKIPLCFLRLITKLILLCVQRTTVCHMADDAAKKKHKKTAEELLS